MQKTPIDSAELENFFRHSKRYGFGLTGQIGSGKTFLGSVLGEMGYRVFNADAMARELSAPGSVVNARIAAAFGPLALGADGGLNRAYLRERISSDPEDKKALEGIMHPAIWNRLFEAVRDGGFKPEPWWYEGALLVDTGHYTRFRELWLCIAPEDVQIARVVHRDGVSAEAVRRLLATQLPTAQLRSVATRVFETNLERAELFELVRLALRSLS